MLEMERKPCRRCGTLMILISGFGGAQDEQTQECLRCGHMDRPGDPTMLYKTSLTDAEQAKRFCAKSVEVEAMFEQTGPGIRRDTLRWLRTCYVRTAEAFELLDRCSRQSRAALDQFD
jgi:hypothetical protein